MKAQTLSTEDLEAVYDQLAHAIDEAARLNSVELFLTKLALLNANALGSADVIRQHLAMALKDL